MKVAGSARSGGFGSPAFTLGTARTGGFLQPAEAMVSNCAPGATPIWSIPIALIFMLALW